MIDKWIEAISEDLEWADIKLKFLKENFEYREFYQIFMEDYLKDSEQPLPWLIFDEFILGKFDKRAVGSGGACNRYRRCAYSGRVELN